MGADGMMKVCRVTGRISREERNPFTGLRASEAAPDPEFRAGLRERLVSAAADRGLAAAAAGRAPAGSDDVRGRAG
ncbi:MULTISPECIES: hypothetical protein [Actinomadura]|uniref:Uncharacterized protein n=1 Tax=Actinomadura yumaensis TaxID=111807 RepID=A0ABW2CGL8_9ACTN|nr:hypothetical protein [Actinomadura sp. J1-007]MWK35777.1 hypothetical protein [Actinomadura sp. J1-007]